MRSIGHVHAGRRHKVVLAATTVIAILPCLLTGCTAVSTKLSGTTGATSGTGSSGSSAAPITITANQASVRAGATDQFTASTGAVRGASKAVWQTALLIRVANM